jgi:hypothetical protein
MREHCRIRQAVALALVQSAASSWGLAGAQPCRTLKVEAQDPGAHGIQAHTADPCRFGARAGIARGLEHWTRSRIC